MFGQNVATICFWFVGLHYQLSYNPKSTYSHDVDIDAKLLITLPNKIYTSISASTNQNNVFVDLFVNLKILQQRWKQIFKMVLVLRDNVLGAFLNGWCYNRSQNLYLVVLSECMFMTIIAGILKVINQLLA